jgi:small subunit ribosomal protein S16
MPVRLRLQRHGKKGKPFYWIVAADSRAVRDGKYLEKIGTYNPNTNPATIDLDIDGAIQWLDNGAQPSETIRSILSYKGVLYKKHLLGGVKKGAFSMEEADKKFSEWLDQKTEKIAQKAGRVGKEKLDAKAKALEAEKAKNADKLAAAKAAEEAAIKAESEAKAAAKAAELAAIEAAEAKPESIDDAVAAAAQEGAHTEESEA